MITKKKLILYKIIINEINYNYNNNIIIIIIITVVEGGSGNIFFP